ncbi:uncharacterized protein ISCGN_030217 [Ixodes scapularis]
MSYRWLFSCVQYWLLLLSHHGIPACEGAYGHRHGTTILQNYVLEKLPVIHIPTTPHQNLHKDVVFDHVLDRPIIYRGGTSTSAFETIKEQPNGLMASGQGDSRSDMSYRWLFSCVQYWLLLLSHHGIPACEGAYGHRHGTTILQNYVLEKLPVIHIPTTPHQNLHKDVVFDHVLDRPIIYRGGTSTSAFETIKEQPNGLMASGQGDSRSDMSYRWLFSCVQYWLLLLSHHGIPACEGAYGHRHGTTILQNYVLEKLPVIHIPTTPHQNLHKDVVFDHVLDRPIIYRGGTSTSAFETIKEQPNGLMASGQGDSRSDMSYRWLFSCVQYWLLLLSHHGIPACEGAYGHRHGTTILQNYVLEKLPVIHIPTTPHQNLHKDVVFDHVLDRPIIYRGGTSTSAFETIKEQPNGLMASGQGDSRSDMSYRWLFSCVQYWLLLLSHHGIPACEGAYGHRHGTTILQNYVLEKLPVIHIPTTPHQNLHKDVVFDHVLDRPIIYRGGTSTSAFETIKEQPNGLMASGQGDSRSDMSYRWLFSCVQYWLLLLSHHGIPACEGAYGHRHGTTILQNYVLEKLPVIHIPTTPHQNLHKDVVFDHVLDRPIIYRGGTFTSAFETIKEQPNGLMASGQGDSRSDMSYRWLFSCVQYWLLLLSHHGIPACEGAYGHRHGTTILQNYVLEKLPVIHIPTTPHQNLHKDVVFDHVLDRPIIYRGGTSTSAFETIKEQPNGLMASGQGDSRSDMSYRWLFSCVQYWLLLLSHHGIPACEGAYGHRHGTTILQNYVLEKLPVIHIPTTPHQNLHKDVVFDHVLDRPIIYRGGTSTSAFETIKEQPNGLMASGQGDSRSDMSYRWLFSCVQYWLLLLSHHGIPACEGAYGHRHGTTILQNYVLEKLPVIHIPTTPHQNLHKDVVFDHVLDRPIIYRGGTSTSAFETIKEQPNGLMASGQGDSRSDMSYRWLFSCVQYWLLLLSHHGIPACEGAYGHRHGTTILQNYVLEKLPVIHIPTTPHQNLHKDVVFDHVLDRPIIYRGGTSTSAFETIKEQPNGLMASGQGDSRSDMSYRWLFSCVQYWLLLLSHHGIPACEGAYGHRHGTTILQNYVLEKLPVIHIPTTPHQNLHKDVVFDHVLDRPIIYRGGTFTSAFETIKEQPNGLMASGQGDSRSDMSYRWLFSCVQYWLLLLSHHGIPACEGAYGHRHGTTILQNYVLEKLPVIHIPTTPHQNLHKDVVFDHVLDRPIIYRGGTSTSAFETIKEQPNGLMASGQGDSRSDMSYRWLFSCVQYWLLLLSHHGIPACEGAYGHRHGTTILQNYVLEKLPVIHIPTTPHQNLHKDVVFDHVLDRPIIYRGGTSTSAFETIKEQPNGLMASGQGDSRSDMSYRWLFSCVQYWLLLLSHHGIPACEGAYGHRHGTTILQNYVLEKLPVIHIPTTPHQNLHKDVVFDHVLDRPIIYRGGTFTSAFETIKEQPNGLMASGQGDSRSDMSYRWLFSCVQYWLLLLSHHGIPACEGAYGHRHGTTILQNYVLEKLPVIHIPTTPHQNLHKDVVFDHVLDRPIIYRGGTSTSAFETIKEQPNGLMASGQGDSRSDMSYRWLFSCVQVDESFCDCSYRSDDRYLLLLPCPRRVKPFFAAIADYCWGHLR